MSPRKDSRGAALRLRYVGRMPGEVTEGVSGKQPLSRSLVSVIHLIV